MLQFMQVIPLLKHPNELISREVLTFLKDLLYGGNVEVQKGLDDFKATREESLFVTLRNIVMQATHGYTERFVIECYFVMLT